MALVLDRGSVIRYLPPDDSEGSFNVDSQVTHVVAGPSSLTYALTTPGEGTIDVVQSTRCGLRRFAGGVPDGVTLDPWNFLWVATDHPALYRLTSGLDGNCEVGELGGNDGGLDLPWPAAGIAADTLGYLWTGSSPSLRIEPFSITWEEVPHAAPGYPFSYGDWMWFAGDPVHAVSIFRPFEERTVEGLAATTVASTMGMVAALTTDGRVVEIEADTMTFTELPFPEGVGPAIGLASDGAGRLVASLGTEEVAVYELAIGKWELENVGAVVLAPMDGLEDVPGPYGTFYKNIVLSGDLVQVDWQEAGHGDIPGHGEVTLTVHFAADEGDLVNSRTSCTFTEAPARLEGCGAGYRFARLSFLLRKVGDDYAGLGQFTWAERPPE